MTTEQRLSDIENWLNINKDSVASFNGRLNTLAQRLAQVETITDAVSTSNVTDLIDRVKMNEAKAAMESGRIDKVEIERTQMVNQLETIVSQMRDHMSETSKAIKAGMDQMQLSINAAQAQVIQTAQDEAGKWAMADSSLTGKFSEIDVAISRLITGMTNLGNDFHKVKEKGVITTKTKEKKNIMEFKVVSNLNTIKDDRKEYRVWTDKLKNAIDQVNTDLRVVLEKIETTYWEKEKSLNG